MIFKMFDYDSYDAIWTSADGTPNALRSFEAIAAERSWPDQIIRDKRNGGLHRRMATSKVERLIYASNQQFSRKNLSDCNIMKSLSTLEWLPN